MRTVQLVSRRRLEERQMPEPRDPGPGEVTVRVRAVGICGSDMHWYLEGRIGTHLAVYPRVLGHEPAGEIVAVGPATNGLRAGMRVAIEPAITCGHCEFCLRGSHNNCSQAMFHGGPQLDGLLRDYVTLPARNVVPVPDGFSDAQATVIEPLAVILHVLELVPVTLGDTVAVIGAGPIGMLSAAVASATGASLVVAGDRVAHRLPIALRMGATHVVDMSRDRLPSIAMDLTRGRGVDIVIDTAAASETFQAGISMLRRQGRYVMIGIPWEEKMHIDMTEAMDREIRIQTIRRSNHNAHGAIALLESGRVSCELVTHRLPLGETPRAFEMLAAYSDGVGKVVIEL